MNNLKNQDHVMDPGSLHKTAELYDYENRIYRVDLTARSDFTTIAGKVDLGFVIDGSASMNFPANLVDAGLGDWVDINHINDNSTNQGWLPNKDQTYYLISDKNSTATVYRLRWKDNFNNSGQSGWIRVDASKNDSEGAIITQSTEFSGKPTAENGMEYPIYVAADNYTRQDFLESSITETLTELKTILNDSLSIASPADKGKEPEVKTAWVTYAKNILNSDYEFKSNKTEIMSPGYSQSGGTSTDLALLNAAGYQRSDRTWPKWAYGRDQFTNYPSFDGVHYGANSIYSKNSSIGFKWEPNSKKYVILITDGAPQRDGYDVDYNVNVDPNTGKHDNILVPDAANYLKAGADGILGTDDDVTLITVGLSMGEVKKGSVLLWKLATRDSEEDPYFYDVEQPEDLKNALYEILTQVVGKAIIVANVTDTVNEAFYAVNKDTGQPLKEGDIISLKGEKINVSNANQLTEEQKKAGYGTVHISANDSYSIEWEKQNITPDEEGWHGIIYVKAREDFLGGNAVRTNDPGANGAKIQAVGYKMSPGDVMINLDDSKKQEFSYETPRVNVNELNLKENQTEWTVYIGTEVNPEQKIKTLYENILVEEVVKAAEDKNGNGLKDKVIGNGNNYRFTIEKSREDNRAASDEMVTFPLKDLIAKLPVEEQEKLNWSEIFRMSGQPEKPPKNEDPSIPEPEPPEGGWNTGISLIYDLYGQDCPGTINIKLIRDHDPSKHNTDQLGEPAETYTLAVVFSPDYDAPPVGQGGTGQIEYHTGTFDMGYQGNAAGTDTSSNNHLINVIAKDLGLIKVSTTDSTHPISGMNLNTNTEEYEPSSGQATFNLYRAATADEIASFNEAKAENPELKPENFTPPLLSISGKTGSYVLVGTFNTDQNGEIKFVDDEETSVIKALSEAVVDGKKETSTYYLVETKAPDGYYLMDEVLEVKLEITNRYDTLPTEVAANQDVNEDTAKLQNLTQTVTGLKIVGKDGAYNSIYVDSTPASNTDELMQYKVRNSPGVELPSTGGLGTNFIYYLGLLLTILGCFGIVRRYIKELQNMVE